MSYIYEKLSVNDVARALRNAGWSLNGSYALAEHLEQLVGDTGEPIELDIVALRCEYSEYADLAAVQAEYPDIKSMDDLRDHTRVIEFDGGLIVGEF